MVSTVQAIVLAAGKSSRMNTGRSKLIEPICGKPMVTYVTQLLASLSLHTHIVVGAYKDNVISVIEKYYGAPGLFIEQKEALGTGHALCTTRDFWWADNVLVMNADVPLVNHNTLHELIKMHTQTGAAVSLVSAHYAQSDSAYGRIVERNGIITIVEAADFTGDVTEWCCINAGIYLFKKSFLEEYINHLMPHPGMAELRITDLIALASQQGRGVHIVNAPYDTVRGVNTLQELWAIEQIKRSELMKHWMGQGVRFSVAQTTVIDADVTIGAGSVIGAGVHLCGATHVGTDVVIKEFSSLHNVVVGDRVVIESHSVLRDVVIDDDVKIGPFAHVHTNSHVQQHAVIGNFVEIKNSNIGEYSKAKHLSYLGDASIGNRVNIGAGTITCNHDGVKKHRTTIHPDAYIGSNNTLVAPVTIGENAFTAAGSTITEDVPANSLALGRARQVNKEGYAVLLKAGKKNKSVTLNDNSVNKVSEI